MMRRGQDLSYSAKEKLRWRGKHTERKSEREKSHENQDLSVPVAPALYLTVGRKRRKRCREQEEAVRRTPAMGLQALGEPPTHPRQFSCPGNPKGARKNRQS